MKGALNKIQRLNSKDTIKKLVDWSSNELKARYTRG